MEPREITHRDIADWLQNSADHMMRLAELISKEGRPLSPIEQRQVHFALYGWAKDILDEIEVDFVLGRFESFGAAMGTLRNLTDAIRELT